MTDYYGNITSLSQSLNDNITGFGEILTASATPLIDLKSIYGISVFRDEVVKTGSGNVTNGSGEYNLSTGTTSGSVARLESVEHGRYVAGFEAVPGVAVRVPSLPTGDEVGRWGYFDANDGFGVGVDSNGMFTFIRKGGVERVHRRSEWIEDLTYNRFALSNMNVYRFPFRWYGAGPVRFYTTVDRDYGAIEFFDKFSAAPGEVITENPNLRIRVEVENNGSASDFQLYVGGRQYFVSGRYNPNRRISSEYRLETSVGTTFVPLVSFKQKTGYESVSSKVAGIDLAAASANIIWQLRWNPTLTGPSYLAPNNLSASETSMEFDKAATAITNGEKISEGLLTAGQGSSSSGANIDVPDIEVPVNEPVTLCARSVSGTATVSSVLKAREEW